MALDFTVGNDRVSAAAEIPADIREMLHRSYVALLGKPNTDKARLEHPDGPAAATQLRDWIRAYAAAEGLTAYLPVFVPEHMTKDKVDPDTGKVLKKGHKIPANNVPKHVNREGGTNVTWRLTKPKVKAAGPDTSTVTVTRRDGR